MSQLKHIISFYVLGSFKDIVTNMYAYILTFDDKNDTISDLHY